MATLHLNTNLKIAPLLAEVPTLRLGRNGDMYSSLFHVEHAYKYSHNLYIFPDPPVLLVGGLGKSAPLSLPVIAVAWFLQWWACEGVLI